VSMCLRRDSDCVYSPDKIPGVFADGKRSSSMSIAILLEHRIAERESKRRKLKVESLLYPWGRKTSPAGWDISPGYVKALLLLLDVRLEDANRSTTTMRQKYDGDQRTPFQ